MTTKLYYKGVCIKVDAYLEEKDVVSEDEKKRYDRYIILVTCRDRTRTFDYYDISKRGIIAGKDAAKVLSSILYMSMLGDLSFDDFCKKTDVSNDSIKAKNTWEKSKGIYSNIRYVMPYDFSISELEKYFEDYKDLTDKHLKLELKELLEKYNASISIDSYEEEPGELVLSRIGEDGIDRIVTIFGRVMGANDLT